MDDYEYELRQDDAIVATGRIQHEQAPEAGDTMTLGSRRVRVAEVQELGTGPRLILAQS